MDTRDLNRMNITHGEITRETFMGFERVRESGSRSMFGYNPDIQREDNYDRCFKWFVEKNQEISLNINKITGLVELPLVTSNV